MITTESPYVFVERKGNIVIAENAAFAPDKKKILFQKGNETFVANTDGTEIVSLGNNLQVSWINADKIFGTRDNEQYLFSKDGKNQINTNMAWLKVGESKKQEALYMGGNTLFKQDENGKDQKIADLPWQLDFCAQVSDDGDYIGISKSNVDGVFYMKGDRLEKIGKEKSSYR